MGDVTLTSGGEYERLVSYSYVAEWQYKDAVASTDPKATFFGPKPWSLREGLIRAAPWSGTYDPARGNYAFKPVVYLPVKRRDGIDQHPTLILSIQLLGLKLTRNPQVPIWAGTTVEVEVVNVLRDKKGGGETKVALRGTLDRDLTCRIEIKPADVKAWLKSKSSLDALVNENLLDFRFKLAGVIDDGRPVVGQSRNRLFLYCRKTIVFLPGLFASQVQFSTASGDIIGFPDFWKEQDPVIVDGEVDVGRLIPNMSQRAGVLECDDKGVPLLPCPKPTLLMLRTFRLIGKAVIDPFVSCHNARMAVLPHVPESFRLFTLIIYPYDWRCDLTDTAASLIKHLAELKSGPAGTSLINAPDTDDQVAVMGHSTGGVVIRRALAAISADECTGIDPALNTAPRPPADRLISFAFFLSVPFAGAPKAGAVLLTGLEAPEGAAQIPFLVPESLVAVSLSMPIVYHLHTSASYRHRPSTSPSRPPDAAKDNEADKAAFVKDALDAGLMPRPWLVRAEMATAPDLRRRLAEGADRWHQLIAELADRTSGRSLTNATGSSWSHVNWFTAEVQKRGLQGQQAVRQIGGWNAYLASRAEAFHKSSEKAIAGAWKKRTCIIWGSCNKSVTLRQLNLTKVSSRVHENGVLGILHDRNVRVADIDSVSRPVAQELTDGAFQGGHKDFSQWTVDGNRVTETKWSLGWVQQVGAGDGTVPSDSQLAEADHVGGGYLTYTTSDDDAPKHMDSTKADCVWHHLVLTIHKGELPATPTDEKDARAQTQTSMGVLGTAKIPMFGP